MQGIRAHQIKTSLNFHFREKSSYDCLKYNFKTRYNEDTFKRNQYRWKYAALEKYDDPLYIIFDCLCYNNFCWVTDKMLFVYVNRIKKYNLPASRKDFLKDQFRTELSYLSKLYENKHTLFNINKDEMYPQLYTLYDGGKISLITLLLLDINIIPILTKENSKDIIVWPDFLNEMDKVKPIIQYMFSEDKIIIHNYFNNRYLSEQSV